MEWLGIINLIFSYMTWKWAQRDFENGHNSLGWINIFVSAMNAAAFASYIL